MEEEILISYRGVNIDQKEYNILSDIGTTRTCEN